jgi:hypothetical protein
MILHQTYGKFHVKKTTFETGGTIGDLVSFYGLTETCLGTNLALEVLYNDITIKSANRVKLTTMIDTNNGHTPTRTMSFKVEKVIFGGLYTGDFINIQELGS